jgi:hypothetical protein
MPLVEGKGKKAFRDNVRELIAAGHKPKQALAIAYKERKKAGGKG